MSKDKSDNTKTQENQGFKGFMRTLILAVFLASLFRSCFYEPFHIPSSSMKPGLLIGDYIFVSKMSYGYSRYSFPFGLDIFSGRILSDAPKRGDVVVFRLPTDPKINYIKRLIGLPGDIIQVTDGKLLINSQPVPKEYLGNYLDKKEGEGLKIYRETLPEGKKIEVLDQYNDLVQDFTDPYTVPAGHYFFMGDNRDNSQDSRFLDKVGFVPEENLVGRAIFIFFSLDDEFWKFWLWPSSIRFSRLFTKIN